MRTVISLLIPLFAMLSSAIAQEALDLIWNPYTDTSASEIILYGGPDPVDTVLPGPVLVPGIPISSTEVTTPVLAPGTWGFYLRARDRAGNYSGVSDDGQVLVVTIEEAPPIELDPPRGVTAYWQRL